MPYAPCPACKTDVKYPRDAEPGTELTCPECDEAFVPPQLRKTAKKKEYSVEDEETYRAERPPDDPEAEEKTRKVVAITRAAAARERERNRPKPVSWFNGPEVWFLIFAIGSAAGVPLGFWLAKKWDQLGNIKMFWLVVGLCLVAGAALGLGMSSWAWLRRIL